MNIDKSYELPFPVKQVYSSWISSKTVIPPATGMDIDPVIGGHYRLFMDGPHMQASNEGKFLEIEPNKFVKYTWEWNHDGEITEISVNFSTTNTGTKIDILHEGFQSEESAKMHGAGWDSYMDGFTAHIRSTIEM